MAAIEIYAGGTVVFDPSDKRTIAVDWDREALPASVTITTSTWTITAVRQSGGTALSTTSSGILSSNRVTWIYLLATTATLGDIYWVSNKIVTNESPAQEIERRFRVIVQDH